MNSIPLASALFVNANVEIIQSYLVIMRAVSFGEYWDKYLYFPLRLLSLNNWHHCFSFKLKGSSEDENLPRTTFVQLNFFESATIGN